MMQNGVQVRKVTLLKKTVTYGNYNEPIETWAADTTKYSDGIFYAEWWDQGGKEALKDNILAAYKDIRLKCRYISGLNERDYRIRKDGDDYDIESIKELDRRKGQILILKILDNA